MVGVLTKTLVRSPVVQWILQARIRRKSFNDVVFVGHDFVQVKQVKEHGHLEHIATKSDFPGRIRAAKTFTITLVDDERSNIKTEDFGLTGEDQAIPPQCIVLTLDSDSLLFVWIATDALGQRRFVHQALPLPKFDKVLFQPGEHLAVDVHCRAIAVAANETELVIYSTKRSVPAGTKSGPKDRWPVIAQRSLQVEGIIQNMDFLIPAADDEDHIVLLLIVTTQRRTTIAVWIDWYVGWDLHEAQIHYAQPVEVPKSVSSILIPLKNASFFLVTGFEVTRWKDILCGSATVTRVHVLDIEPVHPGSSPRQPIWANWSRPKRSQRMSSDIDHIYLVREDGVVCLLQTSSSDVTSSHAGEMGCNTGSAFASLGDTRDPDILIAAGDMSSGRICSIGHWPTPIMLPELDRIQTMTMDLVEIVPNWASVTDMTTSTLPGKSQRVRDSIFVTSCRQPYGAITELRQGLEARLSFYFELEGLRSVTNIWALPITSVGNILLILSSPSGTRLLVVSPDSEMQSIDEVDETSLALDAENQTFAAAATEDGKLIQITSRSICISSGTPANFEDTARINMIENSTIVAAAIDTNRSIAITAERAVGRLSYGLLCYQLLTNDLSAFGAAQVQVGSRTDLAQEPLCLELIVTMTTMVAVIATVDGYLSAFSVDENGNLKLLDRKQLPAVSDGRGMCDSITVLHKKDEEVLLESRYLIICGLRDGSLYAITCKWDPMFAFAEGSIVDFSQSAVKLAQSPDERSTAYAMSGLDTCLLSWSGASPSSLSIESVYVTDKHRPEFGQGSISACTHMPASHLLSSPDLAGSLVLISGDEFLVTSLDRSPATIPRQIPVNGTPNRLIYAEQQRCLVCASLRYDVRHFPSSIPQSKPEERRQIFPVIDFIPSRNSEPSFSYEMQPGERVFGLLEWSFKLSDDKTYSFVLVGGSYTKSSGSVRGRITFLQPVNKHWEVVGVKEGRTLSFDAPVYAMTLLDELSFAACIGRIIAVYRFSVTDRKWEQICEPFDDLGSPGIYITSTSSGIFVSTAEDSFLRLTIREVDPDAGGEWNYMLSADFTAARADLLLSHLVLDTSPSELILASTRHGQLLASIPQVNIDRNIPHSAELISEAKLPRSFTRLRCCNIRPRWKADPRPVGVLIDNVIGCTSEGTIMGIATLNHTLWRRLSWLQRLCELSEEISPHSYESPVYTINAQSYARSERGMPIGLAAKSVDNIAMRTSRSQLTDYHIDGDVLMRLLQQGGAEILSNAVIKTSERDDHAGKWVRQHLDEELGAVHEVIGLLRTVLDCWL